MLPASTEFTENVPVAAAAAAAAAESAAAPTYNVFRDSPLRYMGYANEVGESFRYQVCSSGLTSHVDPLRRNLLNF